MKILLVVPGHLKTVPMNDFSAKALRELGHQVHIVNYHANIVDKLIGKWRSYLSDDEIYSGVNRRIRREIFNIKPDVLFTIYGVPLSKNTLDYAREFGVKTACWWINDPFQFQRGLDLAVNYDVWFSNSAECARQVEATHGVKAHFLPTACDPDVHKKRELDSRYQCDVCFAGDWGPERQRLAEILIAEGVNLRIYGPWQKKIPADSVLHNYLTPGFFTPEQMSIYFSNAKIVLNYHTWYGKHSHGVNPRLFEASGCCSVQAVDFKDEIPQLFEIGKELVVYHDIKELPSLLNELLIDNQRLNSIAESAYQRAIKDHTYLARMKQMIDFL